jgi:hypothetical protein
MNGSCREDCKTDSLTFFQHSLVIENTQRYKFIVDEEWRLNPDHPTVMNQGVVNNTVEVCVRVRVCALCRVEGSRDKETVRQ